MWATSRRSSGTSSRPICPRHTRSRIHPLLDWTELNIWEYIERENIPTVSLYYDQGDGIGYRWVPGVLSVHHTDRVAVAKCG